MLQGKRILLGITGGIAAYKCAELTRRLVEQGALVRVVMTEAATAFITPLTMQAVSGNPVAQQMLEPQAEAAMSHIELARWADLVLVAPATADFIARISVGMANDLLSTMCLATTAQIAIAPAMNAVMYQAQATQANLHTLSQRGCLIWGPDSGHQACGEVGPGRMMEPAALLQQVQQWAECQSGLAGLSALNGKKLLITAGPTREAIDPVRYISNHSSGKMGYALAKVAQKCGAEVTLVSGPVTLASPAGVTIIQVESAQQMHQAVMAHIQSQDIFIATAAVADYRCAEIAEQKIKKQTETKQLALIPNPDILADVASLPDAPYTVGFAAETQSVVEYAKAKMQRKGIDMIAANQVGIAGQGFNADDNALIVLWQQQQVCLEKNNKTVIARQLLTLVIEQYEQKYSIKNC